jgi:5-methylcytosine-specific restriction endonuclease McrA
MKTHTRTSNWIRKPKRLAIYHRDGCTCAYCGCDVAIGAHTSQPNAATLDHVIPHSLGGSNEATNLVTCCARCNSRRQDTRLAHWLRQLADEGYDVDEIARRIRRYRSRQLRIAA